MKLLSFELPGFSGLARGCGRLEADVEALVVEDAGGESRVGWRKPPGSGEDGMEAIVGALFYLDHPHLVELRVSCGDDNRTMVLRHGRSAELKMKIGGRGGLALNDALFEGSSLYQ